MGPSGLCHGGPEAAVTPLLSHPRYHHGGVPQPTGLPVLPSADQAVLEAWLEEHHQTAPGLYVKIAEKGSGIPSVDRAGMVEALLCFGWIDGRANRLDDSWYVQRITPRRPRSVWSLKNVETVGRLVEQDRMRPAGLVAVAAAKADGRRERAYPGPATVTVPDDPRGGPRRFPGARAAFDGLSSGDRYSVPWRVHTATNPDTRAKRPRPCRRSAALSRWGGRRTGSHPDRRS